MGTRVEPLNLYLPKMVAIYCLFGAIAAMSIPEIMPAADQVHTADLHTAVDSTNNFKTLKPSMSNAQIEQVLKQASEVPVARYAESKAGLETKLAIYKQQLKNAQAQASALTQSRLLGRVASEKALLVQEMEEQLARVQPLPLPTSESTLLQQLQYHQQRLSRLEQQTPVNVAAVAYEQRMVAALSKPATRWQRSFARAH